MQRVKWAFLLFLFLLLFVACSQWYVTTATQNILDSLDGIEASFRSGKSDDTQHSIRRLADYCKQQEPFLALFIKRDHLSCLFLACAALPSYADPETDQDFYAELERARAAAGLFFDMI